MAKRNKLLLLCLLVGSLALHGQVPGYMGNYFSVHAGTQITPLVGTIADNDPVYDILPKWQLSAQGVVSKNLAIGVDATYRLEQMDLPYHTYGENTVPVYHDMYSAGVYLRNYTFYNSGSIAPIGNYYTVHGGIMNSYVHDEGQYLGTGEASDLGRFRTIYLGASYGYQSILKGNFLLDRGVRFNLNVLSFANRFADFDNIGPVRRRVGERLLINYGISFYVAIGFLTF